MASLSASAIARLLKSSGPGAYTPESILKTREILEDLTKQIGISARELANNSKKKRITEEEIKMAAKYLLKQ
jgi:histone H3/H4